MINKKAFTLIELLIASLIFTVAVLIIYSAFRTGLFGVKNIDAAIDAYQGSRAVLEQLNTDLRNAFVFQEDNARFTGSPQSLSFFSLTDVYKGQEITREFSRLLYESQDNRITRLCRRNQDALDEKSEPAPEEMIDSAEITFAYAGIPQADSELVFKESWPETDEEGKKLPFAVKVNLTLKGKGEQRFERTIYLPLS